MKGIVGLEAYSLLLGWHGDAAGASRYHATAASYAQQWPGLALDPSGTHYKLVCRDCLSLLFVMLGFMFL